MLGNYGGSRSSIPDRIEAVKMGMRTGRRSPDIERLRDASERPYFAWETRKENGEAKKIAHL